MDRLCDLGTTTGSSPTGLADVAARYRWPVVDRPWVRSNFVATIDGAVQGDDGRSGTINTEADHLVFDTLRALCDVVVVGAGTVRVEGYRAIELSEAQHQVRQAHGLAGTPALLVASRSLELPSNLTDGDGEVLVAAGTAAALLEQCLERGWSRVLLEGGPQLHRRFLDEGLVDEMCVSIAPRVVGGDRFAMTRGAALDPPADFRVDSLLLIDDTVMVRWRRNPGDLPDWSRATA